MEDHPQGDEAEETPDLRGSRRLFLRLLALVYFFAFLSLAGQIEGLVGSRGILPESRLLSWVEGAYGARGYFLLPSLCWLDRSDGFLLFLCYGGAGSALLLLAGLAPLPLLLVLWAFYLSIASVGQVFLGYQWDNLLLETGLLAILVAPPVLRLRKEPAVPRYAIWLLRLLLFRLMFASGVVKLLSGDPMWRSLRALSVHFETQPLPTVLGYYAHQLPPWFLSFSTAVMFSIELLAPWLMFLGRRGRILSAGSLVVLQLLIAATGNYGYFNLLTIALCATLLDDSFLPRPLRLPPERRQPPRWLLIPGVAAGAVLFMLSLVVFTENVGLGLPWGEPALALASVFTPFRSVNSYGLFAVMTTSREEILVEGSTDGAIWKPYLFRHKPGPPGRRPAFIAPFQPRLDWQMWFAALSTCEANPWFERFLGRLLEDSPEVLGLLEENPFPKSPPTRIRTTLYDYRLTRLGESHGNGDWWTIERIGSYCPTVGSP